MNYNFPWWLIKVFVMVYNSIFCPRKMFDDKVLFMFRRFVASTSVNILRLDRITIFKLICTSNLPDPLVYYVGFFQCISFSSGVLKQSRDTKLIRSLLFPVLSFAGLFGLRNFSIWLLSLLLLFWEYLLLYFDLYWSFPTEFIL